MGSRLERRMGRAEMAAGIRHKRIRLVWVGNPLPDDLTENDRLVIIGWEGDFDTPPRSDA